MSAPDCGTQGKSLRTISRPTRRKLTDKEKAFCREYLKDWNAAQAAIRSGYSEASAKEIGFETLTKPHIQKRIRNIQRKRAAKLDLDAQWAVLQFLDCYSTARAKGDEKTAIKALENIGKHLGLYEKDNRQKSGISGLDELRAKLLGRGVSLDREVKVIEVKPKEEEKK